ncbi:IS3 family transposase, partial [Acetobacter sp. DmW_136]
GVGSICRVLSIAPSAYYATVARQKNPCVRNQKDKELCDDIRRVWNNNFCVYGARKVWHQLKREGMDVARCTVERLMRRMGLKGVIRGKGGRTTRPDPARPCPQDLVQRQFHAPAGGFNRSSQHLNIGGIDDDRETEIGAVHKAQIVFARTAACLAA